MDRIDRAEQLEQIARDAGIAGVRAAAAAQQVPSGRTHCDRCDETIPVMRLVFVPAARHCAFCASRLGVS